MKKQIASIAILMIAAAPAAKADETGLAGIHAWQKEPSRRICMSDHFHDGVGTGKTRKQAEAAAKGSWSSFTILEYGTDWGQYALSASQKTECVATGNGFSCATTARACKRDEIRTAARAPKRSAKRAATKPKPCAATAAGCARADQQQGQTVAASR